MSYMPITRGEYHRLKRMLSVPDASVDAVRRKVGRSWDTVNRVGRSKDFDDFKQGQVAVTSPKPRHYDNSESSALRAIRNAKAEMVAHFDAVLEVLTKNEGGKDE